MEVILSCTAAAAAFVNIAIMIHLTGKQGSKSALMWKQSMLLQF